MADNWVTSLKYDPIPYLLSSANDAVLYFTRRDLLTQGGEVEELWELPLAKAIVNKQQPNGSWKYPGGNQKVRSFENYDQIETFRNLGYLVEMFGYNKSHLAIPKAVEFLFTFQTKEGDIRGILGDQYAPYYTAAMAELFIKAGYSDDIRVHKIFSWLESIRQDDGGWTIPLRTRGRKLDVISMHTETLEPDRTKPFSHLITGVVLRAYAAHAEYRTSEVAKKAGELLASSLFHKDSYTDRGSKDFWLRFTYPFWFTDLISALDTLSKLGFTTNDSRVQNAVAWFVSNQSTDGSWNLKALKNEKKYSTNLWLNLAICRVFKNLYG